jgi:aspartokinase-like uncharacterized kinase
MIKVVVKVGGSLSHGPGLRALCVLLADLGRKHHILVVPGGGPFADTVREYDGRYGLGEAASHWMAILAMDQFGCLLSDLIPGSKRVRDPDDARKTVLSGRVAVFLAFDLLYRMDPLPHGWTVTSDSISAWAAELVGAPTLVLLKSGGGPADCWGGGAGDDGSPDLVRLEQLAGCEGVDPYLATILAGSGLDLWIINGNAPERFKELLETGTTRGARLQR